MSAPSVIDPALTRRVEATGWSIVVVGVVCLLLAAFELAVPFVLRALQEALAAADDPALRATRAAFVEGAPTSAAVNGVFGVGLVVVGVAVVRRAGWAHVATRWAAWLSIVALVGLVRPSLAPFLAIAGGGGSARAGLAALGVLLLAAQIVAVVWFLRYWRRPEVVAVFASRGRD